MNVALQQYLSYIIVMPEKQILTLAETKKQAQILFWSLKGLLKKKFNSFTRELLKNTHHLHFFYLPLLENAICKDFEFHYYTFPPSFLLLAVSGHTEIILQVQEVKR